MHSTLYIASSEQEMSNCFLTQFKNLQSHSSLLIAHLRSRATESRNPEVGGVEVQTSQ